MAALDPGRWWPAPSVLRLGSPPPRRHALAAELLGQLCEVYSRPDLPEPIA